MNQSEKTIELALPEEQIWENLRISNDFMFAKVMRNPELCKGMLERLLEISIDYIEYPEEQKVIDISKDSKSVRLDVYLHDEKGTVYNVDYSDFKVIPINSFQSLKINVLKKIYRNNSFIYFASYNLLISPD